MANLNGLYRLNLAENGLLAVPPVVGRLRALRVLRLQGNQLTSLPGFLADLPLEELDLHGNPLPPEEVDALRRRLPQTRIEF